MKGYIKHSPTNILDELLGLTIIISALVSYVVVDGRILVQMVTLMALTILALKERRAVPANIIFFCIAWGIFVNVSLVLSTPSSIVSSIQALIYPVAVIMVFSARSAFYAMMQSRNFIMFLGLILCLNAIFAILAITTESFDFFLYNQRIVPFVNVYAVKGFFFNVNYFLPTIALLTLMFLMSQIFSGRRVTRMILFIAIISFLISMLGFSRSAIIGVFFSFGVFLLLMRKQLGWAPFLTLVTISFVFFALSPSDVFDVLAFAFRLSEDRGDFFSNREELWDFSINHLRSNLFGFGDAAAIENATGISAGYGEAKSVENTYLLQAMIGGYFGVIAYIFVCFSCVSLFLKKSSTNVSVRAIMLSLWMFYFIISIPRVITIGGLGAIPMLVLILTVASYRANELANYRRAGSV